jgi:hypothetical protein
VVDLKTVRDRANEQFVNESMGHLVFVAPDADFAVAIGSLGAIPHQTLAHSAQPCCDVRRQESKDLLLVHRIGLASAKASVNADMQSRHPKHCINTRASSTWRMTKRIVMLMRARRPHHTRASFV